MFKIGELVRVSFSLGLSKVMYDGVVNNVFSHMGQVYKYEVLSASGQIDSVKPCNISKISKE